MSYTANTKLDPALETEERRLLSAGHSYQAVASMTGRPRKSISERNRIIYGIDVQAAFGRRIAREGIPSRLQVTDRFGYWFAGFFDGEGTVGMFTRARQGGCRELRLHVRINIRDDDASVIEHIRAQLGIGRISRHRQRGATKPSIAWTVEKIDDLAEVVIPLFQAYPLRSKKAAQFGHWKPIVEARYVRTLAGYANRWPTPESEIADFDAALARIKAIGAYSLTSE